MLNMKDSLFLQAVLLFVSLLLLSCGFGASKECTNTYTPLSSHTVRYAVLSSGNETWKKEMLSHHQLKEDHVHHHDHEWSNLLPRKILLEQERFDWGVLSKKISTNRDGFAPPVGFLREISLHDVRLEPNSLHVRAQQTNLEYLLLLDVDRLVWSFRKTAGLAIPGKPYGGWESPSVELRGHFVGHYLSASALMWASTNNGTLKGKMSALVSALSECQESIGSGYLSAFPSEEFDRVEAIRAVWAPYYTIHKILAGLLDQYVYAENSQALKMMTWMVDYFYTRIQNMITTYSLRRFYLMVNEEFGGMNDILYKLYTVTGDVKHLTLAHLFDKPCFLGILAMEASDIGDFHANTHIPVILGSQMRYEVTGDPLYKKIGTFFMDLVNSSHSYATGGTSVSEFWRDPKRMGTAIETTENEETCTTYNMLKVSRHLFRWTKEVKYADYYEQAMTNGILSVQRGTDPGVMIYMLPQGRAVSKARTYHGWGTQNESFWCCYGTGVESFSKLGDSIYFEDGGVGGQQPQLYIMQYISSVLNWKTGKVAVKQTVDPVVSYDPYLRVTLAISSEGEVPPSQLNIRVPSWTNLNGAKATFNAQPIAVPSPGSYLSLSQKWSSGDTLKLQFPLSIRREALKDDRPVYASVQAILFGPYLLAAHTTWDWDLKPVSTNSLEDWITPIPATFNSHLVSFVQESDNNQALALSRRNQTVTMEKVPDPGSNFSVASTFRLVPQGSSLSSKFSNMDDAIDGLVMLEPFDLPGMVLLHQEKDDSLEIGFSSGNSESATFHVVPGLDGSNGTVSIELSSRKGCFVVSTAFQQGANLKLSCKTDSSGNDFNQAASFKFTKGISEYDPISFVAKGLRRDFLLQPLLSFRDEYYTVYLNFQS